MDTCGFDVDLMLIVLSYWRLRFWFCCDMSLMVKCWVFWHSWMNIYGFVCVSISVNRTPIFMAIKYIIWRIMRIDINFRDMMEYLEYRLVKEHYIIMKICDYWCSYLKYSILEGIDKYRLRMNINLWALLGYSRFFDIFRNNLRSWNARKESWFKLWS